MKKILIISGFIFFVVITILITRYLILDNITFLPGSNVIEFGMLFDYQSFVKHFMSLDEYSQKELNEELYKRLITANLTFVSTIALIVVLIFKQRKIKRNNKLLEERNALINAQKLDLDKMIKTRDHLFSIIAHDLRGPVGHISVMLDFQCEELKDKINKENMDSLMSLHQVTERTLYLLENLFSWASLQQNFIHDKIRTNDLIEVIDEVVGLIQNQAYHKEIKIKKESSANLKAVFDRDMMLLVLRNLLVNALKFSKEGGEIVIMTEEMDHEVLITVKDDGIGMTSEEIDKIMNSITFYSKKGTKNESGSGLGLKLCQEFIARNGGKLSITSNPGAGSKFSFALPLAVKTIE